MGDLRTALMRSNADAVGAAAATRPSCILRSNADAVGAAAATRTSSIWHCIVIKLGQRPQPCEIDRFWRSASVVEQQYARAQRRNHVCAVFSLAAADFACMLVPYDASLGSGALCSKERLRPLRQPSGSCESTNHTPRRREQQKTAPTRSLWHKRCLAAAASARTRERWTPLWRNSWRRSCVAPVGMATLTSYVHAWIAARTST